MSRPQIVFLEDPIQKIYKIGKKIITLDCYKTKLGNMLKFPRLITITKIGKKSFKEYFVIGGIYYRLYGQVGGKVQIRETLGVCKNIGKKNELTEKTHAISDCASKWKKDTEKDYNLEDEDVEVEDIVSDLSNIAKQKLVKHKFKNTNVRYSIEKFRPMLALKYEDGKKHLDEKFGSSEKIDGIRAICQLHRDDEKDIYREDGKENKENNRAYVSLISRQGKRFGFIEQLREEIAKMLDAYGNLDLILDGELYNHDISFRSIVGAIKKTKTKGVDDDKINYYMYDIVDEKKTYVERIKIMKELNAITDRLGLTHIKFVYYKVCTNEEDMINNHNQSILDGYEGIMLRNLNSFYMKRFRSHDLLKFKYFQDGEFEIVSCEEGKGTELGAILFTCKANDDTDRTFSVRPMGSVENRKKMFSKHKKNPNAFIGKKLTVRYQKTGIEDDSLPRFGVGVQKTGYEEYGGVCIRDYE